MALVKLGSGSNLLGYYMYHGGTNPESSTGITLNETQRTLGTANNDLPVKNYDFQAPLGEFGQTNPQYYALRPLHLFMQDFGEQLATMETSFPAPQDLKKGEDSALRWSIRSKDNSGFIFVNNYERLQNLSAKKNVRLEACGEKLPRLTVPSGCMAVFPVNVEGIRFATAQIVARRDGNLYLMQIEGIPTTIALQNGKTLKNIKPLGTEKPVYKNIYLLSREEAEELFLEEGGTRKEEFTVTFEKVREAGPQRAIVKGPAKVAEAPSEADWEQAAVYRITLPEDSSLYTRHAALLSIMYQGDCARLYADGKLIADHFQYGRPFLYGLWRLPQGLKTLELRILPWQDGAPIYLPREADCTPGESIKTITITNEGL